MATNKINLGDEKFFDQNVVALSKTFPDFVSIVDNEGNQFKEGACVVTLATEHKLLLAHLCVAESLEFDQAFVKLLREGIDIMKEEEKDGQ